jgi:hypothetical protein
LACINPAHASLINQRKAHRTWPKK